MYECRILLAARCENKHLTFFVLYGDHAYYVWYQVPVRGMIPGTGTRYDTRYRYEVPGIYSKQQFAAGTPMVLLYEKGDAVRIEPRPPSPNTCRLCARSSRTLFRLQARGDGTRMQGVLDESRASCPLSINSRAGSNSSLTAAAVRGPRRPLLTMAHTSPASSAPDAVLRVPG